MIKDFYTWQFGHGWFGGALKKTGICPTIDACINFQHTLVVEVKIYPSEKEKNPNGHK